MKELYDNIYNILSKESKEKIDNYVLDVQSHLNPNTDYIKRTQILKKIQKRHHLDHKILDTSFIKFNDYSNRNITIEMNSNPSISFLFTHSTENAYHESAISYDIVDNQYTYQYTLTQEKESSYPLFYFSVDYSSNDFSNSQDLPALSSIYSKTEEHIKSEVDKICNIDLLTSILKNYTNPEDLFDLILIQNDVVLKDSILFSGIHTCMLQYNNLFKQSHTIKNKV